ncbi:MAG TPA: winged helix-turn-helix domain-containing protein, partial [Plasticicumulans sp.]|nr:winged helix-turn-helix domain-containing protein [Plasticicumulans sp.]
MTMWTPDLNPYAGPRYRAIADALEADLREGRLAPGARLPTHRELAERLGVTVGTITRAYAEAEARGLTRVTVGRGTFVRETRVQAPVMIHA